MKSEVFNQSTCIVSTVAYQYYVEKKSRAEITEPYFSCHKMEEQLKEMYDLDNVMIVPVIEKEAKENSETIKKLVALEGARYVQRIITDGDVLGLTWGGTMYHMIVLVRYYYLSWYECWRSDRFCDQSGQRLGSENRPCGASY